VTDVALLLVVLAACGAGGVRTLRALDALPRAAEMRLVVGVATGLGLASIVALGLAAAGILRPWALAAAGAVALTAGGRDLVGALGAARPPRTRAAWLAAALCGVLLATQAPAWLAPPVGGDQTKYQLAYPRLYAQAGRLVPTPWTFWGQQQFLQNFLFAVGFTLRGDVLARLLNAASGVLAALAVATLVRRHLLRAGGAAAGALFFSMPMCWSQMTRAGADTCVVLYAALAVTAWLDWVVGRRPADLRRTAVLAGLAGGSKVMGLLVPALLGLGVLAVWLRRSAPDRRPALGTLLGAGALVLAMLSPWYVRNAVETGNPIHPFGHAVFSGRHWSAEAGAYLDLYYRQYRATMAARRGLDTYTGLDVLRFPWDLTMHPEAFEDGRRQGQDTSPFVLAFAPAVLCLRRRRAAVSATAVLGLAYGGIIAAGAWAHPRYVLPGLALLLAAAVPAARGLLGRRLFATVLALTLAGNLALTTRLFRPLWVDQVRVAAGWMTPETFLRRHAPRWVFWERANRAIPPTGRVLVLEKIPHPYYIDRPFVLLSYLEQGLVDYRHVDSVDALAAAAAALGATHVAVDVTGLDADGDPFEAAVVRLWRAFLAARATLLLEARGHRLYALSPPPAVGRRDA
jgi:hypothetical protein